MGSPVHLVCGAPLTSDRSFAVHADCTVHPALTQYIGPLCQSKEECGKSVAERLGLQEPSFLNLKFLAAKST